MGICFHRVAILFLVILFFMGVFGSLSLRVFTLHTNFCSCMGSIVDCSSVSLFFLRLQDNCLYIPFFLLFLAWVGFVYLAVLFFTRFGSGSRKHLFFSSTYYIDHVCMYKNDMKRQATTNTPAKSPFYATGVGFFLFQSSMNSCVRAFGTNIIVKTWSTICAFPAPNTSKSGIFFPTLISPPVLVFM